MTRRRPGRSSPRRSRSTSPTRKNGAGSSRPCWLSLGSRRGAAPGPPFPPERRPDWGAGKRSFSSVYLEPLPEQAMRDLLAGLVPGLPEPTARAIVARADGVPLYAAEAVGTEELAGALAGPSLAAHRLAGKGPEADALAAQARVTLRAAAERAAALGSHEQALGFLDQALEATTDAAGGAAPHERAIPSARAGTDADVVERHARGAAEAYRVAGDREGIARATAAPGLGLAD